MYSAIQNKRRGMLTSGTVLIHAELFALKQLLEHFIWELFDHPP
jgi:hypothetical protein